MMKSEKEKIPTVDHTKLDRREALKKAGYYMLSTATMMVLMNTQAKAQTSPETAPANAPLPDGWD